ncbi:regulator of G-protein signaling 7 [Drosophila biarmipes]|uniref:regulator of G-protein signaling 7 n=1 Tax=Drosophila biarmipes TaxID=125945 RepID=UPI0007E844B6|nr:regulator of G-protein signaling 7 [Drosophila biarmipes]
MVTMNSEADKTQATNASSTAAPAKTDCSSSNSSDPLAVAIPPEEEPRSAGGGGAGTATPSPTPLPNGSNNGSAFPETEGSSSSSSAQATESAAPAAVAATSVASPPASTASAATTSTSTSAGTTLGAKTAAAAATTTSSSSATSSSTAAAAGAKQGGSSGGLLTVSGNHHHHHHAHSQQQAAGQSSAQPPPPPTASALAVPATSHHQRGGKNEDAPNILVYKKMEAIIEKMQAESTGVAVRTVKAFMSKVPSVFTGADLVAWILKNFDVEDVTEALHFAHLLSSHGYLFPIDDHALTVKNDGTFYRFQTPYFWPSNCWEPENTDYAVYLCKRTMQNKTRLELADYEAENLAKLQKMFSRKWEFIFMQAESQSKVAKKRDKLERKVLDSQERAFWDVHRPMPGCVNTTEIDIKKAYRRGGSSHGTGSAGASLAKNPVEQLTRIIALRKQKLERRTIKVSKAAEALVAYYDQYNEFDYFITSPELPNPWQTDSTEMWDTEKNSKEVPVRRVKRWAFSLRELLNDAIGREQFTKFLEKEYSGENLKFWESVQEMKALPQSEIKEAIQKIWQEFLAPDAPCPVNVDSKSVELAREAVNSPSGPNRWCFDVAASHVYHLMKSDSYSRYLRSDMYKDYLNCSRKKIKSIPNLFGVKR